MLDFKYCIWFRPEENHPWEKCCDGFKPHVSLCTQLLEKDFEHDIESNVIKTKNHEYYSQEVSIRLKGDLIYNVEHDFHALYYMVDCLKTEPSWWPKDAHISFAYRYNKPFTLNEIENIRNSINVWTATLRRISLVNCSGHYKNWVYI